MRRLLLTHIQKRFPWIRDKCLQEISREEVDIGESVYCCLLRIVI